MERSGLDFLKAIFFHRQANPFKHRQIFFKFAFGGISLMPSQVSSQPSSG
jgi:hypothetical protein